MDKFTDPYFSDDINVGLHLKYALWSLNNSGYFNLVGKKVIYEEEEEKEEHVHETVRRTSPPLPPPPPHPPPPPPPQ